MPTEKKKSWRVRGFILTYDHKNRVVRELICEDVLSVKDICAEDAIKLAREQLKKRYKFAPDTDEWTLENGAQVQGFVYKPE